MIEIGVHQNGSSDLPVVVTPSGIPVSAGDLQAVHESFQRGTIAQVRHGILAEQLGYDYYFMTEHHFQPEGAEFSPNPILIEAAVAAQTKRIRLGQVTNIITQWHPIRIAEQAAMLDVISGGRLEFGIGRGYQPREVEVFGWAYGSTIQDQERNRAYFEETFEIILKAWTEPSFGYRGQFYTIPPTYTKWNHEQTIAYFGQPGMGRTVEDVLRIGPPDAYSTGNPVVATTTVLKEISVFPQPVQKPYPQVWEPVSSARSVHWIAQHGVNGQLTPQTLSRMHKIVGAYYEQAEKRGWPDRLNRGPFKYGWDAEKRRGLSIHPWVHIVQPGPREREQVERFDRALELEWAFYGPFGFLAGIYEADEAPDLTRRIPGDLIRERGLAIVGTVDQVTEQILRQKERLGFEDFLLVCHFEMPSYRCEEIEEQMRVFASEVMPVLRRELGGPSRLPESPVELIPRGVAERV